VIGDHVRQAGAAQSGSLPNLGDPRVAEMTTSVGFDSVTTP
jgi:hypothetical protein